MLSIFDNQYTLLTLFGYQLSLLETLAVVTCLACIYLAAKEKVVNFAFGILSTLLYAVFFYQAHLYSSMALNAIFFCFNVYGYFLWTRPTKENMNENSELRITVCTKKFQLLLAIAIIVGTIGWGMAVKHLHEWLPSIFEQATKFPFVDSFVMVASIAAQYLMAKKKLENWFLWVVIDIVAVFLYGFAGYTFTALLYLVLVGIASKGLYDWYRTYKSYQVR